MNVMRLYSILFAIFVSQCHAAVVFTNSDFNVKAGTAFTLTWSGGTGPYTIELVTGTATDLSIVETLASSSWVNHFNPRTWRGEKNQSSLVTGVYAFKIIDSGDGGHIDYSSQFNFIGTTTTTSVTSTSTPISTPTPTSTSSTSTTKKATSSTSSASSTLSTTSSTLISSSSSTTLDAFSTTTTTSSPSSLDTTTSSSSSSTSTSKSEPASADTTLSTGAKAGIGIGAAIGGIILFGVGGFFIFRLGKAAGRKPAGQAYDEPYRSYRHELDNEPKSYLEDGGHGFPELHSTSVAPELPSDNYPRDVTPYELGDYTRDRERYQ